MQPVETSSVSFTLVGSYTSGNFSATSDGHGGTLIPDPPITGGAVATSSGTGSGSEGITGAPGSGTTVHSGGYEFGGGAGSSDGGMRQFDLLLSQFDGFISGFDLGDEIGPHSLGFGSSSSAMSWDAGAPGVVKGANIFNLTLLGQYGANFSHGADGHGGTLITDPAFEFGKGQTPERQLLSNAIRCLLWSLCVAELRCRRRQVLPRDPPPGPSAVASGMSEA
jgi:hypothetical protein